MHTDIEQNKNKTKTESMHHRIATWWFHWPDLQWPDSDNLEKIERRAEGFAKANVTAAMLFGAHFRWDFLPIFPLLHDYIATVAEKLHQYNIKLFDHHSVRLVHRYSTREQMRHVMNDSGPHLPFSPTFDSAATWQYKGHYLNDWRMIDVQTNKPLWMPQYTAEGFCHCNPEFREAYIDYAKYLVAETNIDGLSADDAMHFLQYNSCGCSYCRNELKKRTGKDLPPATDSSFWGNWDNSDWKSWIDLRFDIAGDFYEQLSKALPDNFMLTGCGVPSASVKALMDGADARIFLRGWNYVNMELVGNTPPYKKDKLTINHPIPERFVNSSHHQNVARSQGVRTFCTGFAHSTIAANHVWATAKAMNADAWIGTLKMRLGLPWHILNTLPSEENIVGEAFGFEAKHPELFEGDLAPQLGVYFSYETRNHTLYGNLEKGYYKDYGDVLTLLFKEGITPHTIFEFPQKPDVYPVIVLSGVALMTEQEKDRLQTYLHNGGKIVALGPTCLDNCENAWRLPNQVNASPESFFSTVPDGIHVKMPEWVTKTEVDAPPTPAVWQMPQEGLYYHAQRLCDTNQTYFLQLIRQYMKPLPITLAKVEGYLVSVLQNQNQLTIHLLAEDYDVDIDHELDSMRTHRSRINLLSKIVAKNVNPMVEVKTDKEPTVYTPFNKEISSVSFDGCNCKICLPKHCSYAIIKF